MRGADVFSWDITSNCLRWSLPNAIVPLYKRCRNAILLAYRYKHIRFSDIVVSHFDASESVSYISSEEMVDFTPMRSLFQYDQSSNLEAYSNRSFCAHFIDEHSWIPLHLAMVSPENWIKFWKLSLTFVTRNVVYRFINQKIPSRSFMYQIFPDSYLSDICSICSDNTVESPEHLLFFCPPKQHIWQEIIFEFLWPTLSVQDIVDGLSTLDLDQQAGYYKSPNILTPTLVAITTMSTIWKAHYNYIYRSTPFCTEAILHQIRSEITTLIAELSPLED